MIFINKEIPGIESENDPHRKRVNACIPIAAAGANQKLTGLGYTSKRAIPTWLTTKIFLQEMNRVTFRRGLRVLSRAEIRELI